jgi:shikimate 5-dehydrogenase
MAGDLGFIGVSTQHSLIQKLFPLWVTVLNLGDAKLRGFDHPPGVSVAAMRSQVESLRDDSTLAGALVTTHKVTVWDSSKDLFLESDLHTQRLHEVSCISRNPQGGLVAHAKDPLTAQWAINQIFSPDHWRRFPEGEALILGAGGAGLSLAWVLLNSDEQPARIHLTEIEARRSCQVRDHLKEFSEESWDLHEIRDSEEADLILSNLPPQSLVVNASGLGKDRRGSPLGSKAKFPLDSHIWEFNYRGSLEFLHEALRQQHKHRLHVHDGWEYFLAGWAYIIAEVYRFELTKSLFAELRAAALPLRPTH